MHPVQRGPCPAMGLAHPDQAGSRCRSGGACETREIHFVVAFHVGVEASQTQGGAGRVDECRYPAHLAQSSQRPIKGQ